MGKDKLTEKWILQAAESGVRSPLRLSQRGSQGPETGLTCPSVSGSERATADADKLFISSPAALARSVWKPRVGVSRKQLPRNSSLKKKQNQPNKTILSRLSQNSFDDITGMQLSD